MSLAADIQSVLQDQFGPARTVTVELSDGPAMLPAIVRQLGGRAPSWLPEDKHPSRATWVELTMSTTLIPTSLPVDTVITLPDGATLLVQDSLPLSDSAGTAGWRIACRAQQRTGGL